MLASASTPWTVVLSKSDPFRQLCIQLLNKQHTSRRNLWSIDKWGPGRCSFQKCAGALWWGIWLLFILPWWVILNDNNLAVSSCRYWERVFLFDPYGHSHNYMVWTCTIEPVGKTCSIRISSVAMIFWSCCELNVPNQRTVTWAWLQIFHAPEICGFYWVMNTTQCQLLL